MRGRKAYLPATKGEVGRFICTMEELTKVLGVCDRQIRVYVERGMPRREDKRFYLPEAMRWHTRYIDDMARRSQERPTVQESQGEFERETQAIAERLMREFRI